MNNLLKGKPTGGGQPTVGGKAGAGRAIFPSHPTTIHAPGQALTFRVNTYHPPAPAVLAWRRIVDQLNMTRPAFVRYHQLYAGEAQVTADGALVVTLPRDAAEWLTQFQAAQTRPLDLAARCAGWTSPIRFIAKKERANVL